MSGKQFFVVGLSGPTNSGKSTISSMLCKILPRTERICQDLYFYEPDDPRVQVENGYLNYDTLNTLDMDKMVRDVQQWIKQQQANTETSVLIVEGFLIFSHSELAALIEKKYFITITKEVCEQRRRLRVYNPPDQPGYFDKIVWPAYMRYYDDMKSQNDIEFIEGLADLDTLCQTIVSRIEAALPKEPINGIVATKLS